MRFLYDNLSTPTITALAVGFSLTYLCTMSSCIPNIAVLSSSDIFYVYGVHYTIWYVNSIYGIIRTLYDLNKGSYDIVLSHQNGAPLKLLLHVFRTF